MSEPLVLRLDFEELEAGDLEDITTYSGRDDVLALLYGAFERAANADPDDRIHALFMALPPKVFTALLGIARRHGDPEWTPDRWRAFRFSDLQGASGNGDGGGADPTSAGSTPGSTGAAPPSGQRNVRRARPSAPSTSGPTPC